VARRFNRPISRVVSFGLLTLGLSASHASILTLLTGLFGAAVACRPGYQGYVLAGILFQLASVLDGVDGEMARATLTESEAGARLDTIVDHVTYVAFFAGVTIGWVRQGDGGQVVVWTVVTAGALVLSLVRGARFVAEHAPDASFVFIDRSVRRAAQDSSGTMLRTAAGLFTLLRRDVFAVIFLLTSFTGQRLLVPALVAFGVFVANFTFSIYDRELAAAAAAERLVSH
jgi:CDP-L-myo-inositol myo-inositolphosphotransferase